MKWKKNSEMLNKHGPTIISEKVKANEKFNGNSNHERHKINKINDLK